MSCLVVLLPAPRHWPTLPPDARARLARWCARGERLPDAARGSEALLRDVFDWAGDGLPSAALTRSIDVGDTADAVWLRADPAWVRADMATARLFACGEVGLHDDETALLAHDLAPLFAEVGLAFDAPCATRWYLRLPEVATWPVLTPPEDVLGDDLKPHLPSGADGRRWRQWLNEAQMLLHQHPVNARRAARGAVPVNSLWFWGIGRLPAMVTARCAHASSDDPQVLALARLAGARIVDTFDPDAARRGSLLLDLRTRPIEADVLGAIDTALGRRRFATLELHAPDGERWRVRPLHRWRWWRRAKGVAA